MGAVQSTIQGWASACFDRVRPNPKVHLLSQSDAIGGRSRRSQGAASDSEALGLSRKSSVMINGQPNSTSANQSGGAPGSGTSTPSYASRRTTMKAT
jgi:hypothetical protein